jgi:hypothetical protein
VHAVVVGFISAVFYFLKITLSYAGGTQGAVFAFAVVASVNSFAVAFAVYGYFLKR